VSKAQRQHVIERLLVDSLVPNQTRLVELLTAEGIDATQATVSRDLDELGAVKVRVPGGDTAYAIPEITHHRAVAPDALRRVCGDWVVEVDHSENIVVLRTPPGSAHVVASAIDRTSPDGIIGTVAGDDTIFVVAAADIGGSLIAESFRDLAGL
jgi:transcriptional regulator of arginine metabolism